MSGINVICPQCKKVYTFESGKGAGLRCPCGKKLEFDGLVLKQV